MPKLLRTLCAEITHSVKRQMHTNFIPKQKPENSIFEYRDLQFSLENRRNIEKPLTSATSKLYSYLPNLLPLSEHIQTSTEFPVKFSHDLIGPQFVEFHKGPTCTSNYIIPNYVLVGSNPLVYDLNHLPDRIAKVKLLLESGIDIFVCLQTVYEMRCKQVYYFDLMQEIAKEVYNKDIKFLQLEIEDFSVAEDHLVDRFTDELVELLARLPSTPHKAYIHCLHGHGRSGVITAIIIAKLYNLSAEDALRYVQACHDSRNISSRWSSPQNKLQIDQVFRIVNNFHEKRKQEQKETLNFVQ